jgi:signal transduction histidine kinase
MIGSVLLKPSVSIAPALFPPNALAFCAYYLLPRPLWVVNLFATTSWDLLVIPGVTHLVAGTQPTVEYVLIVSWSSALIGMGTALAVRTLGLETRAGNNEPIAVPLLLLALAVGSIPGDLLATWVHARAAHGSMKAEDVSVRMLSAVLTIVTISPLFMAVLRRVEATDLPLARATEIAGIATSFAMLFAFYYIAPWPLDRFLELMLLAGPMLWLALRCSHFVVTAFCALVSIGIGGACARGFGQFPPLVSLGAWQDGILSCQVFLLIASGGTMLINSMVLKQRQLLEDSRLKQEMLLAYGKALDDTENAVRHTTAQDLHDGVAQIISGQSMILDALFRRMSPRNALKDLVEEALAASREAQSAVRATIDDLYLPQMDQASLKDILATLGEFFQRRYRFDVNWQIFGDASGSGPHNRLVYRAVKELLMNALKHSDTTAAEVLLKIEGDSIRLSVSDSGKGFDPGVVPNDGRRRLGLSGLSERVGMAGGRITVDSSPGAGCRVDMVLGVNGSRPTSQGT